MHSDPTTWMYIVHFKNGCNGEDGKFLVVIEGKQGMRWGWFYNGGWKIFEVSLHSWKRDANTPNI